MEKNGSVEVDGKGKNLRPRSVGPPFLLSSFPFLSPPSLPFALVLSPAPCPVAAATHVRGGIHQEPSGGNDLLLRTENGGNGNVRFPFTVW